MPMEPLQKSESFLEAGGGNIALPHVAGWLSQTLSDRSAMNISGEYRSFGASQSAIHNFGNILATLSTQLGEDPALDAYHSQELNMQAGYAVKDVATNNLSTTDRALSQIFASASLVGDISKDFHYHASIEDHELDDGLSSRTTESSQNVALGAQFDLSNIRVIADGNYSLAALFADTNVVTGANFFGGTSTPIHAESVKALIGERNRDSIEYYGGVELLAGTGVDGSTYTEIMPVLRARMQLSPLTLIGLSFEPQEQLASLRTLTNTNPFYAPELILLSKQNGSIISAPVDGRSVVMDKINLAAYMNYFISPDDELRVEARYITRDREAVFNSITSKDSATIFTVTPESTQRFIFSANGNFIAFARDNVTGTLEFTSVTPSIPYEATTKLFAEYHFNSIWENVQPSLAINVISRPGQTFTFLDINVKAEITPAVSLAGSIENLLGSPSDFWPGYPEKPRSIWATVRYTF